MLLWGMSVLRTLQREGESRVVPLLRGDVCLLQTMLACFQLLYPELNPMVSIMIRPNRIVAMHTSSTKSLAKSSLRVSPAILWGLQATCCFCYAVLATRWILQDQMHIQVSCCNLLHSRSAQTILAPQVFDPMLVRLHILTSLCSSACVHRSAGLSAASPHACYASDHAAGALCGARCTAQAK